MSGQSILIVDDNPTNLKLAKVLLAAEGKTDLEIAASLRISNKKAARWRQRFLKAGFAGLEKRRFSTRPKTRPSVAASKN